MVNANRSLLAILFVMSLLIGGQKGFAAENQDQYKKLLVTIPVSSINPGEKFVGAAFTVTNGRVSVATVPRGWTCQLNGVPGRNQKLYCSSPHESYAITNIAMLEVILYDMSKTGEPLGIEATVEMQNNDGQRFSKHMTESELSIR